MSNKLRRILFVLALVCLLIPASRLFAQIEEGMPVDKIAAIVGNEVIMMSDVKGQLIMISQQNPSVNPNDPKAFAMLLDEMINEKLLITKAIEDSIVVSDEQIDQRWQTFLQTLIQQYGSEDRIEKIYQKSISRLKYELRDDIRNKILSSTLIQQKMMNIEISPKEIEEFYNSFKDSLQSVPPQYELYHIVKNVAPDTSAKRSLLNLAKSVRDSLLKGGDFADFAKRYSDDAASAADGGMLGWIEKGKFIAEFESAAFNMQLNEISTPVETPFGYHIIQVLDKRKESMQVRHILFKLSQTSDDKQRTIKFLDSLSTRVKNGESFEELAKLYSDDRESKGFGGYWGTFLINQMPAKLREYIDKIKDGEITEAIPFNTDVNKQSYHIILRKKYIPAHNASMETDSQYISKSALEMKKMKEYNDFIKKLRTELYWEIKK